VAPFGLRAFGASKGPHAACKGTDDNKNEKISFGRTIDKIGFFYQSSKSTVRALMLPAEGTNDNRKIKNISWNSIGIKIDQQRAQLAGTGRLLLILLKFGMKKGFYKQEEDPGFLPSLLLLDVTSIYSIITDCQALLFVCAYLMLLVHPR
jgi:hypothetical protein